MKPLPRQTLTAPIRRVRFVWVATIFCFWVLAIGVRLVWLQVVRHNEFVQRASKQQIRGFEVAPRRGVLYDRNLRELAMTVLVDSVYAVPSELVKTKPATQSCWRKSSTQIRSITSQQSSKSKRASTLRATLHGSHASSTPTPPSV